MIWMSSRYLFVFFLCRKSELPFCSSNLSMSGFDLEQKLPPLQNEGATLYQSVRYWILL